MYRQERLAEHGARMEEHRQRLASHREMLSGELSPRREASPTINLMSKRLHRTDSVENILHGLGRTYAEKLEQRKLETYAKELSEVHSPSINPSSADLVREGTVHDRLMQISREREQKLKKAREEALESQKSDPEAKFSPRINAASKKLTRTGSVQDLCLGWAEEVKKRTEREREEALKQKQAQYRKPEISERSKKLAAKVRAGHQVMCIIIL